MSYIEYIDRGAIVETPEVAFTYAVSEQPRDFEKFRLNNDTLDWSNYENYLGDYVVMPYGSNNDLDEIIKEVIQNNYIAPGLLKRKTELLWGLGPRLYTEKFENNRIVKNWLDDKEIWDWFEAFKGEEYLLNCAVDYQHVQGAFTKFELNKGSRIGKPMIKKLEHIQHSKSRQARKMSDTNSKPTHVIVTDWNLKTANSIELARVYPIFDYLNPFLYPNSIMYSNMYTFCTDYYSVPDIYGSLEWLNRSTAVPLIFKALSKNSINLKYHIESPQAFWDRKEETIKQNCTIKGIEYKEEMLQAYQKEFLQKISKVLSGEENTGKYLHTTKSFTVDGTNLIEHGWTIKVIDQNIKDFVEAQIKISQRADRAVASGISLHSALGNMSETGKVDSGSEQHYALISYLNTGIDIQEMIICKPINYALKANWPNKNIKMGFYHNVPEKQEDVSPSNRSINNAPTKQ